MPEGTENTGVEAGADATDELLQQIVGTPEPSGQPAKPGVQTPAQAQTEAQAFKFAGRDYRTQQEAEKTHKALYGRFSEAQGVINHFKSALKNPAILAELAKDENNIPILEKLGLQVAREEQEVQAEGEGGKEGMTVETLSERLQDMEAKYELRYEMQALQEEMKRKFTPQEIQGMMGILHLAPGLSAKQAYYTAFHERDLAEAEKKAKAVAASGGPKRPPPGPVTLPGTKMDMTKPVQKRTPEEWREGIRQDAAHKAMMADNNR